MTRLGSAHRHQDPAAEQRFIEHYRRTLGNVEGDHDSFWERFRGGVRESRYLGFASDTVSGPTIGGVMLNIGEFARAGDVSVRMLRHYDQLGLLTPADVDLWNGRRRYDLSQLGTLHRIATLKELGFTLVQVADLLVDGVGARDLREMWRLRRTGLLAQVNEVRHRLAQLDARLGLIESECGVTVNDEIVMKRAGRVDADRRC